MRAREAHLACAVWLLTAWACGSPSRPSVTVVAGRPAAPAQDAAFSYYSQPVTLVVTPGITATGATPTTVLEVATDAAFSSIAISRVLPPAVNGQATVTLDHLAAATTYYWRVKTTAGDNPSVVSATSSFAIGPQLVLQAPTPVTPLATTFPHKRPTFTVANATRTGPPATLTYRFEIASHAGFNTMVATATVAETPDQTSFTATTDLASGATFYWRAQASDTTKGATGPYSSPQAFATVFPEDGSFRYALAIHSPPYCLTHVTHDDYCGGTKGWDLSDYSFDGTLTVVADHLQFSAGTASGFGPPLMLGFARVSNRLSGAVSGAPNYPLPNPGPIVNALQIAGVVAGDSDNGGHFEGSFDGHVELVREGFPCYHDVTCSTSGFAWTLTPR